MKTALLLILISAPFLLCAQKNVIKGRAAVLPAANVFTFGIGVERMIGQNMSAQILFNRMGSDFRDTDGSATFINAFVPEVRRYFNKKNGSIDRAFFGGVFNEINFISRHTAGAPEETESDRSWGGESISVNPGILIGKNKRISNKWYLEGYIGAKCRFITRNRKYRVNNIVETRKEHSIQPGIRAGLNIGFRF